MTTVEKDQIGNDLHLTDLRGAEQQTIGQHDAAARAAVDSALFEHPVRGDVHDTVGFLIERVHYVERLALRADRLLDGIAMPA